MSSVLCMTGWQQPADSLSDIAPDAVHFDYAAYDNVETMFAALPRAPRVAVGWSLGGQLLVRAIAGGHIWPGALILLGAPFQWVADAHFTHGVPQVVADEVQYNYARDPESMLAGFHTLIAHGDTQEKSIIRALNKIRQVWKNGAFWLGELAQASCCDLNFSVFPRTVLVHGLSDKVIPPANAKMYAERLPASELMEWLGCAHAPHLHNPQSLRERIRTYV